MLISQANLLNILGSGGEKVVAKIGLLIEFIATLLKKIFKFK